MKKNKKIFVTILLIVLFLFISDMRLKTVIYKVKTEKVDMPLRLLLITDLHSCWYGKEQKTLLQAVEKKKPDIVLLGGDIFDDDGSYENAETVIRCLSESYPCYYVTGNHEYWSKDIDNILSIVRSYGVTVLSGDCDRVTINGQNINICGVDDPDVLVYVQGAVDMSQQLKAAETDAASDDFTVLLSHRPELADTYREYGFDLVLCGHAHGGQWRIPGILNGLFAPDQGLFPKYAGGRYDFEGQTMIVSRGLARESTLAPRFFNRPELVVIEVE